MTAFVRSSLAGSPLAQSSLARLGLTDAGIGLAPTITATVAPSILAVNDSQTPADALAASATSLGNYQSNVGAIVSAVPTFTVNDVTVTGSHDLEADDVLEITILVTDDQGTERVFDAGLVTVSAEPVDPPFVAVRVPDTPVILDADIATFKDTTGWDTNAAQTFDTAGDGYANWDGSQTSNTNIYNTPPAPFVINRNYAAFLRAKMPESGRLLNFRTAGDGFIQGDTFGFNNSAFFPFEATGAFTSAGFRVNSNFDGQIDICQYYDQQAVMDRPKKVIGVGGQSNAAAGSSKTGYDAFTAPMEPRALYVNGFSRPNQGLRNDGSGPLINPAWSTEYGIGIPRLVAEPLPQSSVCLEALGPITSMATEICERGTPEGFSPCFVGAAHGSTSLDVEWNKDGDRSCLDLLIANVNAMLAENPLNEFAGLFWCQGESTPALNYAVKFKAMIDYLRGLWGEFPVVIMEIGQDDTDPTVAAKIAEQKKCATGSGDPSELTKCVYVPRPAGWALESDNIHYTGTTNLVRGTEAAQAMIPMFGTQVTAPNDHRITLPASARFAISVARALEPSYTGNLIRVRRSSDDAEADIGIDGNGNLDEAALLAFTGTGVGDHGVIRSAYDQLGKDTNADLIQTDPSLQPSIVRDGVVLKEDGLPVAKALNTGADHEYLEFSSWGGQATADTLCMVAKFSTEGGRNELIAMLSTTAADRSIGIMQEGSVAPPNRNSGASAFYKNGVEIPNATRGDLHSAFVDQGVFAVRIAGSDMTQPEWANLRTEYPSIVTDGPYAFSEMVMLDDTHTTEEVEAIEASQMEIIANFSGTPVAGAYMADGYVNSGYVEG